MCPLPHATEETPSVEDPSLALQKPSVGLVCTLYLSFSLQKRTVLLQIMELEANWLETVGKACWDMSSSLDAWGSIETWQHNSPSEQVQDVTRNQSLHRFRLPVILNALSCVVLYCPSYKLATYLATTEGHWRKPHWRPRPRRLFHHPREPLSVL